MRSWWILLLSMITIQSAGSATRNVSSPSGLKSRSCIAGLCIFPDSLPIKQVIREYGGNKNAKELCYPIPKDGLCMKVTAFDHPGDSAEDVVSLEIKRGCSCKKVIQPLKAFPTILTSEGLGVGDSFKKVISIYGIPRWIRAKNASAADKLGLHTEIAQFAPEDSLLHGHDFVFGYVPDYDDLNALFVYIDEYKVAAIEASISE